MIRIIQISKTERPQIALMELKDSEEERYPDINQRIYGPKGNAMFFYDIVHQKETELFFRWL